MRKEFFISLNKGRPKIIDEIDVLKVRLHGRAPEIFKVTKLDSHPDDVSQLEINLYSFSMTLIYL